MAAKRGYKVISFDLDGTLVDYESDSCYSFRKARDRAIEKYPEMAEQLTDELFVRGRQATYIQFGDTGIPLKDWFREWMRTVLESLDIFDFELAGQMGEIYGLFRNTTLTVFEDALQVVPKLAGTYTLSILSNGSSKLQKLSIAEFFSHSIYAREVGYEKPAPEIFHAAAKAAGCTGDEMLYVGDGQYTDILGASNAGIDMVWINRERAELLQGIPRPEYEIHDLRDILDVAPI
jgi:putative hydrolase of the HAD superfamily